MKIPIPDALEDDYKIILKLSPNLIDVIYKIKVHDWYCTWKLKKRIGTKIYRFKAIMYINWIQIVIFASI